LEKEPVPKVEGEGEKVAHGDKERNIYKPQ